MKIVLLLLVLACFSTAHIRVPRRALVQIPRRDYRISHQDAIQSRQQRNIYDEEDCVEDLMQVESKSHLVLSDPPFNHRSKRYVRHARLPKTHIRVPRSPRRRVPRQVVYDFVKDSVYPEHEKPICVSRVVRSEVYRPHSQNNHFHHIPNRPPTPGTALYRPQFPNARYNNGNHWIAHPSSNHFQHRPQAVHPHYYEMQHARLNHALHGGRYHKHHGYRYMHQNWPNANVYHGMMSNIHTNDAETMQPWQERHIYRNEHENKNVVRTLNVEQNRQSQGRQSFNLQNGGANVHAPPKAIHKPSEEIHTSSDVKPQDHTTISSIDKAQRPTHSGDTAGHDKLNSAEAS